MRLRAAGWISLPRSPALFLQEPSLYTILSPKHSLSMAFQTVSYIQAGGSQWNQLLRSGAPHKPLLRMDSSSGDSEGGGIADKELFFSPPAVPAAEAIAWESGFSARMVSFTVVFAVFKRLMNWQGDS